MIQHRDPTPLTDRGTPGLSFRLSLCRSLITPPAGKRAPLVGQARQRCRRAGQVSLVSGCGCLLARALMLAHSVNTVTSPDSVLPTALAYAAQLCANSPDAVQSTKLGLSLARQHGVTHAHRLHVESAVGTRAYRGENIKVRLVCACVCATPSRLAGGVKCIRASTSACPSCLLNLTSINRNASRSG